MNTAVLDSFNKAAAESDFSILNGKYKDNKLEFEFVNSASRPREISDSIFSSSLSKQT